MLHPACLGALCSIDVVDDGASPRLDRRYPPAERLLDRRDSWRQRSALDDQPAETFGSGPQLFAVERQLVTGRQPTSARHPLRVRCVGQRHCCVGLVGRDLRPLGDLLHCVTFGDGFAKRTDGGQRTAVCISASEVLASSFEIGAQ